MQTSKNKNTDSSPRNQKKLFTKWPKWLSVLVISVMSAGILLYAVSSFFISKAARLEKTGNFQAAFDQYQKASKIAPFDDRAFFGVGYTAWKLASTTNDIQKFPIAQKTFDFLVKRRPHSASFLYYSAICEFDFCRMTKEKISGDKKNALREKFKSALKEGKNNPEIEFRAAKPLFSRLLITEEEKKFPNSAAEALISAAQKRSDDFFLPSAGVLWKQYKNWDLIKSLVGEDFGSQVKLLKFSEENSVWRKHPEIYKKMVEIWRKESQEKTQKAENLLKDKKWLAAQELFQNVLDSSKSFYFSPELYKAQEGSLIARFEQNENRDEYFEELEEIFLTDSLSKEDTAALKEVVMHVNRPETNALFYYYLGDYRQALDQFLKSSNAPFYESYLAATYSHLGEKEKASELIAHILKMKSIDLRALQILSGIPEEQAAVEKQMDLLQTRKVSSEDWWGKDKMTNRVTEEKIGRTVSLRKGIASFDIKLLNEGDKDLAVQIIVWNESRGEFVGEAVLKKEQLTPIHFSFPTLGGKRWLEIKIIGFSPLNGSSLLVENGNIRFSE